MALRKFTQPVIENLRAYLYALVDPRDGKIFYIGKGNGNRVFDHVTCALETKLESDKLNIIREIQELNLEVKHYIIRHDLDDDDAYTVESVLIDFLTFDKFKDIAKISNIVAGHHQFDKGIKTVDEIETLYNCPQLDEKDFVHKIMTININGTYGKKNAHHPNLYEATRKSWKVCEAKAKQVEFVLSEYRGIIRGIFQPTKWYEESLGRWMFDGEEITPINNLEVYSMYMNKRVPEKVKGMANPIRYFGFQSKNCMKNK